MKRTKLFIGLGAFTLALGSFFATKANNKKFSLSSGYFTVGAGGTVIASQLTSMTAGFTTTQGTNKVVVLLKTNGISAPTQIATLYTGSGSTASVIYHN